MNRQALASNLTNIGLQVIEVNPIQDFFPLDGEVPKKSSFRLSMETTRILSLGQDIQNGTGFQSIRQSLLI